jgi:hypothetical protein
MVCSWLQVSHWKNSITLFEHATRVTSNNAMAISSSAPIPKHRGARKLMCAIEENRPLPDY